MDRLHCTHYLCYFPASFGTTKHLILPFRCLLDAKIVASLVEGGGGGQKGMHRKSPTKHTLQRVLFTITQIQACTKRHMIQKANAY